jgi:hypothetical protein
MPSHVTFPGRADAAAEALQALCSIAQQEGRYKNTIKNEERRRERLREHRIESPRILHDRYSEHIEDEP